MKLRIVLAQNSLVVKVDLEKKYFAHHKQELQKILENLCENTMQVKGKSTFKDEFVTAGGVDLKKLTSKRWNLKFWKISTLQEKF